MTTLLRKHGALIFGLVCGLVLAWAAPAAAIDAPHDASKLPQVCATCHVSHIAEPTTCGGACPVGQHARHTDGVCVPDETCPGTCAANEICTIVGGVRNCQCPPNRTGAGCNTCAPGYSGPSCTTASTTCASAGDTCAAGNGVCLQTGCGGDCPAGQHNRQSDGVCVTDETCPGTCGPAGACSVVGGVRVCSCPLNYVQDGTCSACAPGYTGGGYPTCAFENTCAANGETCANGNGTCALQGATCTADCPAGYHNRQSDGVCVADTTCPGTCGANQICDDSHGEPVCSCPIGRTGANCATVVAGYTCTGASCTPNACLANGQACGNGTCASAPGAPAQEQITQSDAAFSIVAAGGWTNNTSANVNLSNGAAARRSGTTSGDTLRISITTVAASGTYHFWLAHSRVKIGNGGGVTTTLTVNLGAANIGSVADTADNTWSWTDMGTVALTAGAHTFDIICTGNNTVKGCGVDGVVLTTEATNPAADAGFIPYGTANWNVASLDFYVPPGSGGFTCGCATGYTGALCNGCAAGYTEVNGQCVASAASPCNGVTCSGQGACYLDPSKAGGAVCDCSGTYSGATPTACNVCNATGGFTCGCKTGYTGLGCTECAAGYHRENGACVADPNDCGGTTCDGQGACFLTSSGTGLCDCNEKYSGSTPLRCDTCPSPSLACQCKPGYTGATCSACAPGYHAESGKCVADGAGICELESCSSRGACYPTSSRLDLATTAACACNERFYGLAADQCDQCAAAPTQPYLLNNANGVNSLCLGCHSAAGPGPEVDTHWGTTATVGYTFTQRCSDCHDPHTQPTPAQIGWSNGRGTKSFLRKVINTPNSGAKTITFNANTGPNSWADGAAPYDGICEVCHTQTTHHRNSTSGGDHTHNAGTQCTSCHTHDDTGADNLGFRPQGGGDCTGCHASPQPGNTATARRNVVSDFNAAGSHHIKWTTNGGTRNAATAPLSKFDCVICHLEGDAAGGTTAFHNDAAGPNTVNLRDVDNAANTAWMFQDPDVIVKAPNANAQLSNVSRFCQRCHDANGIGDGAFLASLKAADLVAGSLRSALQPFGDGKSPVNVVTQFNPANASSHSIKDWWNGSAWVSGYNPPYPNATGTPPMIATAAWVNGWDETKTTECADCHMGGLLPAAPGQKYSANGHGSENLPYLLNSANGLDESVAAANSGVTKMVCGLCHNLTCYEQGSCGRPSISKWADHGASGMGDYTYNWLGTPIASGGGGTYIGCYNCHAGMGQGQIHGVTGTRDAGGGQGAYTQYVFMSGATLDYFVTSGSSGTCSVENSTQDAANPMNMGCTQHTGTKAFTVEY